MPTIPSFKELLQTCPGLTGDIARYIDSHLETEQPAICLAAAFSFMSTLLSKRVYYEANGRVTEPPLFTFIVADTGAGKTTAQSILTDILEKAKIPIDNDGILTGEPASDSALLKALARNSRRLLLWDEMGISISAYANSSNSFQATILSTAMKVFSSAGRPYIGKEYSTQDRVDIQEPYLSIFGASTFNRFFGALSQDFLEDGFLPRWLMFFEQSNRVVKQSHPDSKALYSIVSRVREINTWRSSARGSLADLIPNAMPREKMQLHIEDPELVWPYSVTDDFKADINEQLKCNKRGSVKKILYTRAWEQCVKICLCLTEVINDKPICSADNLNYAITLTKKVINNACSECEKHIYKNSRTRDQNENYEKVHTCISIGEKATRTIIHERTRRFCNKQERESIIEDLLEAGKWNEYKEYNSENTRQKSSVFTRIS